MLKNNIPMAYQQYITVEAGKRSGQPCVIGTRITVVDVLGWLAAGMTVEEIIEDFPRLNREAILACLEYAAAREKRVTIAA